MASATHLSPTSPLSVMVPNPRRGIFRALLSVTSGIEFSLVLVFDAANDCALPRLRNIAEAANSALVCKNWRRLIPLELRSSFILVVLWRLAKVKILNNDPDSFLKRVAFLIQLFDWRWIFAFRFLIEVCHQRVGSL